MPDSIDFATIDLAILLSNSSVQQLLDIAHEHPDWSNRQIFEQQYLEAHVHQGLLTYKQALAILRRFRLHTVTLRRLRQYAVGQWEATDKAKTKTHILEMFPDFLSYITYRQNITRTKQQQTTQTINTAPLPPEKAQQLDKQPLFAPAPQPVRASHPRTSPVPYTKTKYATFKQLDRFFSLAKQFTLMFLLSFLFFFAGSLVFG